MAAVYPGTLPSFTTKTDKVDLVSAAHVNDLQNEVVAIATELGTDVAGSLTDLKTRLALTIADSGVIKNATSDPGTPSDGQIIYRTDTDRLKIYNGASWDVMGPTATTKLSTTSMSADTNSGNIAVTSGKRYMIFFWLDADSSDDLIELRFNSQSGATDYDYWTKEITWSDSPSETLAGKVGEDSIALGTINGTAQMVGHFTFDTTRSDNNEIWVEGSMGFNDGGGANVHRTFAGRFIDADAIADFEIVASQATTGSIIVYELT